MLSQRRSVFRVCILCLCILTGSALASSSHQQRNTFLQAEKQLWKPGSSRYQELYNQLHFYPLQPYLDQRRLMHKLRLSKAKEIDEFLDKYKGTPLDWPLRKKWLTYLAKRNRQSLFIEFYQPTSDATLTCHYLNFQFLIIDLYLSRFLS